MNTDTLFLTAEDVYSAVARNLPNKKDAELLLKLRDWFINVCNFDPRTGQALPLALYTLLSNISKLASTDQLGLPKDRISKIVEHSDEALRSIIGKPRDKVLREHAMMPIYAAREVDSASVQWLSRRSGRTLREKLAGKPYIKAVNRRMCLDTAENRLLKAFIIKLEQLLLARNDAFGGRLEESYAELLQLMQRWFRNDDVMEIGSWSNLPPNNTLLRDKNYRKVWDAWLWLQALDENIQADHERLNRDWLIMLFWTIVSKLSNLEQIKIVEQPFFFEYDTFSIRQALNNFQVMFFHKSASKPQSIIIKLTGSEHLYFECGKNKMSFDTDKILISERNVSTANHFSEYVVGKILDVNYANLQKRTEPLLAKRAEGNNVIIDLYSIRPEFVNDSEAEQKLPFRLVRQYWNSTTYGITSIDLGFARAITLRSDVTTISMLNLLSQGRVHSTRLLSDAAMEFTKKLNEYLKPKSLTYLISDSINEFSLENIRRNINCYFFESKPLPRSIATVFAWQASDNFKKSSFNPGDCVLVLEATGERVSITPLIGCKSKENDLQKAVPATKGFYWERHPSIVIKVNSPVDDLWKAMQKNGCQIAKEIAELWGRTGIEDDCSKLSWVDEKDNWHTFSSNPHLPDIRIKWVDVQSAIKGIVNKSIFLTFIGEYAEQVKFENLPKSVVYIETPSSLVSGGQILAQWQLKTGDIPLWRDHLPELSFGDIIYGKEGWGYWGTFELVKDATVTPQKGKRVQIPVKDKFRLPAGQTHYKFPLLQGEGAHELQYMAYLKSRAFPLKQDTLCRLEMTYTYGADDPYELQFVPKKPENAGFKSVRVEWRELRHSETAKASFPVFPTRYEWRDFECFPKKDGSFNNLLEWNIDNIKTTRSIVEQIEKLKEEDLSEGRFFALVKTDWKEDKNGNHFCFCDSIHGDVFCHEENFIESDVSQHSLEGKIVSFSISNQLKPRAKEILVTNISLGRGVDWFRTTIRFPALTVWNSHSLSESDTPDSFRKSIIQGIDVYIKLANQNVSGEFSTEALFFLSCLHKDAPKDVPLTLMRILKKSEENVEPLEHYFKHVAFSIGDCELEWQAKLLEKILCFIKGEDFYKSSIGLQVLSIAIWRSEQLIFKFSQVEIHLLVEKLFLSIELNFNNFIKVSSRDNSIYVNPYEIMKLELLLSLLRTRGSHDEIIKRILSPEKEITKKFVAIVDNLTQNICDKNLDVRSRVSLQIDKPEAFHNTPDLLYALRMYLTENSGANAIQVTGVSDED